MPTTHHDVTKLLSYRSLLNDDTVWMRQTYGDAMMLAWKGRDSSILSLHTLFSNYDTRPAYTVTTPFGSWKETPRAPRLSWLAPDLGAIYTTEERLFETLRFYFNIQLRYRRETGGPNPAPCPVDSDIEDEVTSDYEEWLHDEALCIRFANQCALHFIEHHITTKCFMPEPTQMLLAEHSLSRADREDQHAPFESLVDQAAS